MSKLPSAEEMTAVMDNQAMVKEISENIELTPMNRPKMTMCVIGLSANTETNIKSQPEILLIDGDVESVTLDSITGADGEELEFEMTNGCKFVPSFDSKEDGKWIVHYFVKNEEEVMLKLKASYDHNTGIVKSEGHGFNECFIRIDLKPKVKE